MTTLAITATVALVCFALGFATGLARALHTGAMPQTPSSPKSAAWQIRRRPSSPYQQALFETGDTR